VISTKTSPAALVTLYDVSVSDLRESRQVEVSELSGTDGVLEVGKQYISQESERSEYVPWETASRESEC
jgi:hypothetical protein